MDDRGPFSPEMLSMMCSVLERSAKEVVDGLAVDDVTTDGIRISLATIIIGEARRGEADPEALTKRVIDAYRRRAANT
jgi:hypothetical protein